MRGITRQEAEPRSLKCRAVLPTINPAGRAPAVLGGRKKLFQRLELGRVPPELLEQ